MNTILKMILIILILTTSAALVGCQSSFINNVSSNVQLNTHDDHNYYENSETDGQLANSIEVSIESSFDSIDSSDAINTDATDELNIDKADTDQCLRMIVCKPNAQLEFLNPITYTDFQTIQSVQSVLSDLVSIPVGHHAEGSLSIRIVFQWERAPDETYYFYPQHYALKMNADGMKPTAFWFETGMDTFDYLSTLLYAE